VVLLFPFTTIPPGSSAALQACFGRLTLVRPTQSAAPEETGNWPALRVPVGVDEKRVQTLVREYASWADLHQGNRGIDDGLHRFAKDPLPFAEDGTPSRIRDAIRRAGQARTPEDADTRLVNDLVFLSLAERYDRQSFGVQEAFRDLSRRETELLDALRGDEGVASRRMPAVLSAASDPGAYMTPERLSAWARVARCIFADPPFPVAAVTTSQAVIETLAEGLEGFVEIVRLGLTPSAGLHGEDLLKWRRQLADYVVHLSGEASGAPEVPPPTPLAGEPLASLTLYAAPGVDWPSFLAAAGGGADVTRGVGGRRMIVARVHKEG
jgi:hypothetical protein